MTQIHQNGDLGEQTDDDLGELLDLSAEWNDLEISREVLNREINRLVKVGESILVQTSRGWEHGTVHWVPYVNGPAATHIYITLPRLKEPRRIDMGGGVFSTLRIPRRTED